MIPPLFGLPVETWIDIFNHCLLPQVVFGHEIKSFQIEAYHRALFDGDIADVITSANERRVILMLVCRDWRHILDKYVGEVQGAISYGNPHTNQGRQTNPYSSRFISLIPIYLQENLVV